MTPNPGFKVTVPFEGECFKTVHLQIIHVRNLQCIVTDSK